MVQTINQRLGRAIKQTQHRHHRAFDRQLATVGTTLAQWDALRAIARNPAASAHLLATETFQSDQAFGTLANRLANQELIVRNPGHGRKMEHHLTRKGQEILAAGERLTDDVLKRSFSGLSRAERATLLNLLMKIGSKPLDF